MTALIFLIARRRTSLKSRRVNRIFRGNVGSYNVIVRWFRRKTEIEMTEMDAPNKLHSLLFHQGRELVNIKFFPGTDRGLTSARLQEAAAHALEAALAGGLQSNPPVRQHAAQSLDEFMATR